MKKVFLFSIAVLILLVFAACDLVLPVTQSNANADGSYSVQIAVPIQASGSSSRSINTASDRVRIDVWSSDTGTRLNAEGIELTKVGDVFSGVIQIPGAGSYAIRALGYAADEYTYVGMWDGTIDATVASTGITILTGPAVTADSFDNKYQVYTSGDATTLPGTRRIVTSLGGVLVNEYTTVPDGLEVEAVGREGNTALEITLAANPEGPGNGDFLYLGSGNEAGTAEEAVPVGSDFAIRFWAKADGYDGGNKAIAVVVADKPVGGVNAIVYRALTGNWMQYTITKTEILEANSAYDADFWTYINIYNLDSDNAITLSIDNVYVEFDAEPSVSISGPISVVSGTTATFTATPSFFDEVTTTYTWTLTDPNDAAVDLTAITTDEAVFTTPELTVEGTYTATVTVTDNEATVIETASVVVTPAPVQLFFENFSGFAADGGIGDGWGYNSYVTGPATVAGQEIWWAVAGLNDGYFTGSTNSQYISPLMDLSQATKLTARVRGLNDAKPAGSILNFQIATFAGTVDTVVTNLLSISGEDLDDGSWQTIEIDLSSLDRTAWTNHGVKIIVAPAGAWFFQVTDIEVMGFE